MNLKTLVAATTLLLLPSLALALGCSGRGHQAQSCAPGTVWDAAQQQCVKQVSS